MIEDDYRPLDLRRPLRALSRARWWLVGLAASGVLLGYILTPAGFVASSDLRLGTLPTVRIDDGAELQLDLPTTSQMAQILSREAVDKVKQTVPSADALLSSDSARATLQISIRADSEDGARRAMDELVQEARQTYRDAFERVAAPATATLTALRDQLQARVQAIEVELSAAEPDSPVGLAIAQERSDVREQIDRVNARLSLIDSTANTDLVTVLSADFEGASGFDARPARAIASAVLLVFLGAVIVVLFSVRLNRLRTRDDVERAMGRGAVLLSQDADGSMRRLALVAAHHAGGTQGTALLVPVGGPDISTMAEAATQRSRETGTSDLRIVAADTDPDRMMQQAAEASTTFVVISGDAATARELDSVLELLSSIGAPVAGAIFLEPGRRGRWSVS